MMVKVKKLIALGVAASLLAIFAAGCGSDKQQSASAEQTLPKKIVIGLDDNFPPMGFRDEAGKLVGFDIDMAREAAKRSGMEIEFKPIDWSSKEAELKSKHIDVLWNGLTILPEREKNILFSDHYLKDSQIIIVKKDSPIQSKQDLVGKVVGTQEASTADYAIQKDPLTPQFKEFKKYSDYVNAFMDLELGRLDALVVDGISGRYMMTKKPGIFRTAQGDYGGDVVGVGFRKEDTALRDKINSVINTMKQDGSADQIAKKWFGTDEAIIKTQK